MSSRRQRIAAVAVAVALGGCGVPTGPDSFEPIDGADVPNRLDEVTTTTTTTLPPPSTTPTTLPDQPTTTTTTEPEPQTAPVDIFFISGGSLRSIPTPAPIPPEPIDLILLLENGPVGPLEPLADTVIEQGLIESTSREGGVITIELNERVFRQIDDRDQLEAVAQMVLTFLGNLVNVGQAVFTIDDEPLTVPVANRTFTDEPVSTDDYSTMLLEAGGLDDIPAPTTTTTTSTVEPQPIDTDPPGSTTP